MRVIDADRLQKQFDEKSINPNYRVNMHNIKSIISNAPTVEAIPKDQYEARLKADLKAILVELQLEIEELRLDRPLFSRGYECYGYEDKTLTEIQQECSDIIQEKINALRGNKE